MEPGNNFLETMKQVIKTVLIIVMVFSFFSNLLMLAVPIYMLQIYDRVLVSFGVETLLYLTIMVLLALLVFGLLEIIRSRIMLAVSSWVDRKTSPMALIKSSDELLSGNQYAILVMQDIQKLRGLLGGPLMFTFFDIPWMPIYIAVIYVIHPVLGWLSVAGAVWLFLLALANELLVRKHMMAARFLGIEAYGHYQSIIRNPEIIQSMGMMPGLIKRWFDKNEEHLHYNDKANSWIGLFMGAAKFSRMAMQALMLGIGALLVIHNELTPGGMIAASILLGRAYTPVDQAITAWFQFLSSREAYKALHNYFMSEDKRSQSIDLPAPTGELEVDDLTYIPPNRLRPTVRKVNMKIPAGEVLVMIGPSGAGKTTLARLMTGTLAPNRGCVRLDGADVYQWKRTDFGKYVGYLPQDIELFSGKVFENIARMHEASSEEIIAASKLAGIHELILKLPNGYETDIAGSGSTLSGGQRQRIALARAVFGIPKLVVLDEPNSNLDNAGIDALVRCIKSLREMHTTVVLITHHPALLEIADKILVMQEGQAQLFGDKQYVLERLHAIATQQPAQNQRQSH